MDFRVRLLALGLFVPSCFSPDAGLETDLGDGNETGSSGTATDLESTGPNSTTGTDASTTTMSTTPTETNSTESNPTETNPTETESSSSGGNRDCGNGEIDGGEDCDDGTNDGGYGGCNADCTFAAFCGDGDVQEAEACDDGDEVEGNGCNTNCVVSGTPLWTHLFVTGENDDLDSPSFRENGNVLLRARNPSLVEARVLSAEDGEIDEVLSIPTDTISIVPWGQSDGFIVVESIGGIAFAIPDIAVSRYSSSGVEQWRRLFESQVFSGLAVNAGTAVFVASFETPAAVANEGDRIARSLDAGGSIGWSDSTFIPRAALDFDDVAALTNGTSLFLSLRDLSTPASVLGFNAGGGQTLSLEFEANGPRMIEGLDGGRWLSEEGDLLRVRDSSGDVVTETTLAEATGGGSVAFATLAANGDILVAGGQDVAEASFVSRLSSDLEVLWEAPPTTEDLAFFEISGLAAGPQNQVLVTADVVVVNAQARDGWAILLAP